MFVNNSMHHLSHRAQKLLELLVDAVAVLSIRCNQSMLSMNNLNA